MNEKDVEKIINELEIGAINSSVFAYENCTYSRIDEYSIWKVPEDTNLYYIEYVVEVGEEGSWGKSSETEEKKLYFRFQSIFDGKKNRIKIEVLDDYDAYDGLVDFMTDDDPLFSSEDSKEELSELDRYKRAYEIFMEYFDYIPDEDQIKVHKQLNEVGL